MRERLAEYLTEWGGLSWWSPSLDALVVVGLLIATLGTVGYIAKKRREEEARRATSTASREGAEMHFDSGRDDDDYDHLVLDPELEDYRLNERSERNDQ